MQGNIYDHGYDDCLVSPVVHLVTSFSRFLKHKYLISLENTTCIPFTVDALSSCFRLLVRNSTLSLGSVASTPALNYIQCSSARQACLPLIGYSYSYALSPQHLLYLRLKFGASSVLAMYVVCTLPKAVSVSIKTHRYLFCHYVFNQISQSVDC